MLMATQLAQHPPQLPLQCRLPYPQPLPVVAPSTRPVLREPFGATPGSVHVGLF